MYVYILTNPTKTVLYIGITNNLTRRLYEHSSGRGDAGKFTGRYQTDLLVYFELCSDAVQVVVREKQKAAERLGACKKDALITAFNPSWETIDLETWAG